MAVLLIVGLGACGDGAGGTATQTAKAPGASSSKSGTASPAEPTPISWGSATFVQGTVQLNIGPVGTVTYDEDGTRHSRDGTLRATLTANDPRVSGTVIGTWNSDRWGTEDGEAMVQWGTATLSNEEGSWEAPYSGVYTTESGDYISRWYVGAGGYEGLTFFMWLADPGFQGLIYKGDPPPQR
jgi:hypothetical protein